jgi:hypothetical protein
VGRARPAVSVFASALYRVIQEERPIFWEMIVSRIFDKNFHMNISIIQGDSGGKANILGDDGIANFEKNFHMNMCRILNGYQDIGV